MSWNIAKPGDQINGPVSITGALTSSSTISGTQIISTVATGTAPLTVASTTNVTNLNADLLDGQQGSYYQSADNINAGTLVVGRGGTGASTFTAGRVLFGNGTSALNTSANLFWDNSNASLGISSNAPVAKLDVRASNGVAAVFLRTSDPTAAVASAYIQAPVSTGFSSYVPIFGFWYQGAGLGNPASDAVSLITASSERLRIASDGVCTWSNVGGVAGTAMTLNGTGLGVGTSPSSRLTVSSSGSSGNSTIESSCIRTNVGGTFSCFIGHDTTANRPLIQASSGNAGAAIDLLIQPYGGNVGIGTSTPAAKLDVSGAGIFSSQILNGAGQIGWVNAKFTDWSDGNAIYISALQAGGGKWISGDGRYWTSGLWRSTTTTSTAISLDSGTIKFFTNSGLTANTDFYPTERARIDASGNLGLGVTPANWSSLIGPVLQINNGSFYAYSNEIRINANFKYDGADKYISNGYATSYNQASGAHYWYSAANNTSGANAALTWGGAKMTLDASGNLGIGTATIDFRLDVRGAGAVYSSVTNTTSGSGSARLRLFNTGDAGDGFAIINNSGASGQVNLLNYKASTLAFWTDSTQRLSIKSTGQVNFVGLASDPAGSAAGDVYYNTTTNKLKCYNGTTWNDLF